MNKNLFLNTLKEQLKGIPENDLNDIMFDYNEHFIIGLKEGRDEEEIAKSLGNPRILAKEIKADYMITKVEESFTATNFLRALLATIGLGFFNLVFILGPFIGIAAALFSFVVAGIAIVISGIATIVATFIAPLYPEFITDVPANPVAAVLFGVGIMSLGLLWTIGSIYLNKFYYILTIKYLKFNLNIITNRRK